MIKEEMIPRRIREIRLKCKMTQQELADAAGVTKGYISKIENGVSAPPVGTLIAFAQALRVELNAFFEAEDPEVFVAVTRKNHRPAVAHDGKARYEHLALNFPQRAFESHIITAPANGKTSRPHKHKGQELLFILKGRIDFTINGRTFSLQEGDAIHFNADQVHYGTCVSEEGAELIGIIFNDREPGRV